MKLLRRAVDGITLFLGNIKRGRIIRIPSKYTNPVKVNLGCGLAVASGWINVDGSLNALIANFPVPLHPLAYRLTGASRYYTKEEYCRLLENNFFVHHDLAFSIPLDSNTADFVYSSHFLEHLFRNDAENLLRECYRVLKPGGTVRIVVPDLEYALSLYTAGEKEAMLSQYFFVEDDDSYYARHKYMYDFALLKSALEKSGFHHIERCDYQSGRTPDLMALDNRAEESLFVEAMR